MALNVSNTYNVETDNTFFQYIFKKGKKPSDRLQKNPPSPIQNTDDGSWIGLAP